MGEPHADVRAYLEIRSSAPSGWSPDGGRMLVSTDLTGTAQLRRLDLGTHPGSGTGHSGGAPRPIAELPELTACREPVGGTYLPAPCPDGTNAVLLVTDEGGNERTQLYLGTDEPTAVITDPGRLDAVAVDATRIHRPGGFTRDGTRVAYATNRDDEAAFDAWVRELASAGERRVYATGGWTSPVGWSPDGRILAVSELTTEPGDNRLQLVDVAGVDGDPADADHPSVTELAAHPGSAVVGVPAWMPDSDSFFFATDVGREFTGVARGAADGRWEYVVESGWPTGCAVDQAGRSLLVVWNEDGVTRAELRDPHTLDRRCEVELPGEGVAGGFGFSRDGALLAFAFSSPTRPGDVWCFDVDRQRLAQLTASPCGVDRSTFVPAEQVRIPSFDGLELPTFVFRPRGRSGAGPRPVVVVLHGGPESQYRPSFAPVTQYLVARGFVVIAPNVRGSTGYGRSYQHLDDVDLRSDAVRDLAAVHDWIATQPDLDEDRSALYGASYGGYLVLAGLTSQPERWASGVDIVGISDLVTFLENTAPWRRAFREREYGSLAHDRELLRELSPITHVDRVRAPLFVVHGANDPRVPLGEAEQIHDVLTRRGLDCELVVYPDEGHGIAKLHNRVDCYPRVVEFLHRTLGAG